MSVNLNVYQQPVGEALDNWTPCPRPEHIILTGRFCRLEPLNAEQHASELFDAYGQAEDSRDWTYLPLEPFERLETFREYLAAAENSSDPLFFTVIELASGRATGTLSLMRIEPAHGVMEVGHVNFSPLLKRTPVSTEAHFLLMEYAFEQLGYRRYEWKCDNHNAPSKKAAERLGFTFEGVFRQAIVYKGRTRDTAWFSIIDSEWPARRDAFMRWLNASNFDALGQQKTPLSTLRQSK